MLRQKNTKVGKIIKSKDKNYNFQSRSSSLQNIKPLRNSQFRDMKYLQGETTVQLWGLQVRFLWFAGLGLVNNINTGVQLIKDIKYPNQTKDCIRTGKIYQNVPSSFKKVRHAQTTKAWIVEGFGEEFSSPQSKEV